MKTSDLMSLQNSFLYALEAAVNGLDWMRLSYIDCCETSLLFRRWCQSRWCQMICSAAETFRSHGNLAVCVHHSVRLRWMCSNRRWIHLRSAATRCRWDAPALCLSKEPCQKIKKGSATVRRASGLTQIHGEELIRDSHNTRNTVEAFWISHGAIIYIQSGHFIHPQKATCVAKHFL